MNRNLIEHYQAGSDKLRRAVAGLSREQLQARPGPGAWSIQEVIVHLADSDAISIDRMKRMIALDKPTFLGADENRFAATLAYHERDVAEELGIIELTRKQFARILKTHSDDVLQRVGVHSERGPKTLAEMLAMATNHIVHHVKFIAEKRQALGLAG